MKFARYVVLRKIFFMRKVFFLLIIEIGGIIKLIRCFFFFLFYRKKVLLVRAAVICRVRHLKHFNWGDDINLYFLSLISGKKIVFLPHSRFANIFSIPSYLGIGSIISFYNLNKTTIIGSGILSNSEIKRLRGKPSKICFVRGPLTRDILIKYGIDCPKIYGDLALALPLYYKTKVKKIYRIGIVLHLLDEKLDSVKYIQKTYPDIKIIHMNSYGKWTDVIDEINECDVIFSSALHGLIVSEAYGVCSKWISFSDRKSTHWDSGYEFKYIDFYASIGKKEEKPYVIVKETNLYKLAQAVEKSWIPASFDAKKLIEALPEDFVGRDAVIQQ